MKIIQNSVVISELMAENTKRRFPKVCRRLVKKFFDERSKDKQLVASEKLFGTPGLWIKFFNAICDIYTAKITENPSART